MLLRSLAALLFFLPSQAGATWFLSGRMEALCEEPMAPQCVGSVASFESQEGYDACAQAVKEYVVQMNFRKSCIQQEIDEIDSRASKTLHEWQCRAGKFGFADLPSDCVFP
jgi:hypothetical protein